MRRHRLCSHLFGLSLGWTAFAASAQDGELAVESSFFEALPTVLSVSRLPQPQNEAPGAVTIIDR
ncbi:MAG: hypothetical protein HGA47_07715, partial [Zoogloea sp.]|nr:hypothetical protein [Zoogloea sp.]